MARFPGEVKRGPLKGRTFESQDEYDAAKAELLGGGVDTVPERPAAPRAPRALKVTREMADAIVSTANLALTIIPATRNDTLDEVEAKALALAIIETAKTNRAFAAIILKICAAQSNARLASTIGCIVAVRLARHEVELPIVGKVPPELAFPAQMMLYALAEEPGAPPAPAPTPHVNGVVEPLIYAPVE